MTPDAEAHPHSVPLMTSPESDGDAASRRLPLLLVRHWRWAIMLMVAAYLIAGTFWRAPWKADEPYSFGIVLNIIERGDWIVPNVAFEPFVEKPPLMYWSGALAALAVPELPPHEAVRLAVLFWMELACLAVWRTARLLRSEARDWRMRIGAQLARGPAPTLAERRVAGLDAGSTVLRDYALGALLLFVGCIGLVEHVHKFIADVPQLAGTALALYGLVRYAKACETGGADGVEVMRPALWFGTGLGVAFLGKGVLVPGLFALTVVAAMALLPDFRSRQAWRFYLVSLLAASPWLLIWPVIFWRESPDLFIEWFWVNNIGRFFGFTHLGGEKSSLDATVRSIFLTGTPAVWPALGVLGVSLWKLARQRGRGARAAWLLPYQGHLVVALFVLVTLAVVLRSAVLRDVYLMPLQPALALLGAPMLMLMPPGMARAHLGRAGCAVRRDGAGGLGRVGGAGDQQRRVAAGLAGQVAWPGAAVALRHAGASRCRAGGGGHDGVVGGVHVAAPGAFGRGGVGGWHRPGLGAAGHSADAVDRRCAQLPSAVPGHQAGAGVGADLRGDARHGRERARADALRDRRAPGQVAARP